MTLVLRRPRGTRRKLNRELLYTQNYQAVMEVVRRYHILQRSFIAKMANVNDETAKRVLQSLSDATYHKKDHYFTLRETGSINLGYVYQAAELLEHKAQLHRATLLSFGGGSQSLFHDLMVANAMANIELGLPEGHTLVTPEEILPKLVTREAKCMIAVTARHGNETQAFKLRPDNLFGIRDPQGDYDFFALECENENTIASRTIKFNSTRRKFAGYIALRDGRQYQAEWGIPNLRVIFLGPTEAHTESMKDLAKAMYPTSEMFLFATQEIMTPPFKTPRPDATLLKRLGL